MNTSILDTLERKKFVATERDIELLAAAHLTGATAMARGDGGYLKILLATLKTKFSNGTGPGRRRTLTDANLKEQADYLTEIHGKFYASVLKGITTPDIEDSEMLSVEQRRARALVRNSRAGFARSAASTLLGFLRVKGDIRGLKIETVTKGQLRAFVVSQRRPDESPRVSVAQASMTRLTRDIAALAVDDPDAARVAIEAATAALEAIVAQMEATAEAQLQTNGSGAPPGPTETQSFRTRTRAAFAGRRASRAPTPRAANQAAA